MQRWFVSFGLLGILAGSASAQVEIQVQVQAQAGQAQAKVQPLPGKGKMLPGPALMPQGIKMTQADAIFVGRVVAIEPMDVEAPAAPGQANVKYRVAVIQVSDSIYGLKKGAETVRVAFLAQPNGGFAPGIGGGGAGGVQVMPAVQPAIQPRPALPIRRPPFATQMNLTVGQDGMFVLNKHHKENFYLAPIHTNFVTRDNNPGFDGEVKTAKQLAKVMANPVAALKGDDKDDRYTAAAILISKYRSVSNPTGAPMKQEPIDADESKLILTALAGGDWTPGRSNAQIPNPDVLFRQLDVTPKDGYDPSKLRTQQEFSQAMQKWLDENSGKYRINRQVVDPNAKAPAPAPAAQPGGQPGVAPNPRPGVRPNGVQIQPLPAPAPPPAPAPNK